DSRPGEGRAAPRSARREVAVQRGAVAALFGRNRGDRGGGLQLPVPGGNGDGPGADGRGAAAGADPGDPAEIYPARCRQANPMTGRQGGAGIPLPAAHLCPRLALFHLFSRSPGKPLGVSAGWRYTFPLRLNRWAVKVRRSGETGEPLPGRESTSFLLRFFDGV